MSDETTPAAPAEPDFRVTIEIPTTEHLSQARLEEIATQCELAFEPAIDGAGIQVVCRDQGDADFWTKRGAFWAEQARAIA